MFDVVTPESIGVSSSKVRRYLELLNRHGLAIHSVLMARGEKLFCQAYYKPYSADDIHRMYSVTKSYTGVAVCEMAARGLISLDDKIVYYFGDKLPQNVHPYLQAQTIRSMLKMQTCMHNTEWYRNKIDDRLAYYFSRQPDHYPETGFWYDSDGSFVLGVLIERVTGKKPLEYLREICLDKIGFSKSAKCLDVVGGYPWGDSALVCTPMDTMLFARLLANGGVWNGKRLLSEETVKLSIGNYTDTHKFELADHGSFGYGFQIWHSYNNGFAFLGMHGQLMFYDKNTDITFFCTGGTMGDTSTELIAALFYSEIIDSVEVDTLPENLKAQQELSDTINKLEIPVAYGNEKSYFEDIINGKEYKVQDNKMGITKFSLTFDERGGKFYYTNAQGEKTLIFGRKKNVIQAFPQTGYSSNVGGEVDENNTYRCAVSAAWGEEHRINIKVQIIDDYIGALEISIGFNENHAWLVMKKNAENFLNEYEGTATAEMV